MLTDTRTWNNRRWYHEGHGIRHVLPSMCMLSRCVHVRSTWTLALVTFLWIIPPPLFDMSIEDGIRRFRCLSEIDGIQHNHVSGRVVESDTHTVLELGGSSGTDVGVGVDHSMCPVHLRRRERDGMSASDTFRFSFYGPASLPHLVHPASSCRCPLSP